MVEVLETIDRSSGRLHKRVRMHGETQLLVYEGDNLDTAGTFDIVTAEVAGVYRATHPRKVCTRCYGDPLSATYAAEQGESE